MLAIFHTVFYKCTISTDHAQVHW